MADRPTCSNWKTARCSSPTNRTAPRTAFRMLGRKLPVGRPIEGIASWVRPLVLGSAAALIFAVAAAAQTLTERIEQCGGCHGEDGNSRLENIPSLAGQPEF